jgi:hypothetical protein
MKRSKFSDSQIIDAVKRVESGIGVPVICRELGVSLAKFYKWRAMLNCTSLINIALIIDVNSDTVSKV